MKSGQSAIISSVASELPALVLIDSVVRLLPECLGRDSAQQDSFMDGLLVVALYASGDI